MDIIYQGTTWRRQVLINDTSGPVDPTGMVAVLCPETPIAISQTATGDYLVSIEADATALLIPGQTHWEMFGTIGSDVLMLTRQQVTVQATCKPEVTP